MNPAATRCGAAACLLALVLGGCADMGRVAPAARAIDPASVGIVPEAFAPALDAQWWRGFGDPTLTTLVERALAEQPSLKVAQARLARVQAALAGAQAAAGPRINGGVDVTRQRFSANSIYPPPLGGSIRTLATAQFDASWEIDFFGRHRAEIEAAAGSERAAQADLAAAHIVLASSVARAYMQLSHLLELRQIAQRALQQRGEMLVLTGQRVHAGIDSHIELRQGEAAMPLARQQVEQIDEQIALVRHALAALTAQPPAALDALTPPPGSARLPPLPEVVPADLLGRRADITAARWRVDAASNDVQGARALFYPNINLAAFAGVSSIGLNQLVRAGAEQYGAGPALRLPIFDAGRLRANLRGKGADLDAAVQSYNAAVLEAVHEVADALGALVSIARQQREQAQATAAVQAGYVLAQQRQRAGLGNALALLNAEGAVLNQRRLAADLDARIADAQIALIKALGGGYASGTEPAARNTAAGPSAGLATKPGTTP